MKHLAMISSDYLDRQKNTISGCRIYAAMQGHEEGQTGNQPGSAAFIFDDLHSSSKINQ